MLTGLNTYLLGTCTIHSQVYLKSINHKPKIRIAIGQGNTDPIACGRHLGVPLTPIIVNRTHYKGHIVKVQPFKTSIIAESDKLPRAGSSREMTWRSARLAVAGINARQS